MPKIDELEKEIDKIKARNEKVEEDKAWETSWVRKILIFVFTYFAITIYFYAVGLPEPFINSVVPSVAFVISTFTLPFFKKLWVNYSYRK